MLEGLAVPEGFLHLPLALPREPRRVPLAVMGIEIRLPLPVVLVRLLVMASTLSATTAVRVPVVVLLAAVPTVPISSLCHRLWGK